jgi:outer membrane lipoprotein-sorting protein
MKRLTLILLLGLAVVNFVSAQTEVQPTLAQLSQIKQALSSYEDVNAAEAAGYEKFMDCMSGP